jgi:hypothetical protein
VILDMNQPRLYQPQRRKTRPFRSTHAMNDELLAVERRKSAGPS